MKFLLYLIRWQLSTPVLALAMVAFDYFGTWLSTVLANLIGGCLFYFVDKFIFRGVKKNVDKHQKKQ